MYSKNRTPFLKQFFSEECSPYIPHPSLARTLWGITFRGPLLNAAGLCKNAEAYELMTCQGASGWIAGTTTAAHWDGNVVEGITWPFMPYRDSGAASNKLGLPNDGDYLVASRIGKCAKTIPIGASVAKHPNPEWSDEKKLEGLVQGITGYCRAGADFIELNESCPNTGDKSSHTELRYRLCSVSKNVEYDVPIVVKFSNDTPVEQVPMLMDVLFEKGFDGVNFGNTSTDYAGLRSQIDASDRRFYDWFTKHIGGGVSGRPLKDKSLKLCAAAVDYLKKGPPKQEFHVIRTGGIETARDLQESDQAGVSLNEWYTGYMDAFAKYNHEGVYRHILEDYTPA